MTRLQLVGEYIRFESTLPGHLRELAILVVARAWDQDFEWGHHVPIARDTGLDEAIVAAVGRGERIDVGSDGVRAVWQLVTELIEDHAICDPTFTAAVKTLGDAGVVELIVLAGYYTTLAMTMNAARTPTPDDYERLPSRGQA
jgi:4-carboxymuconolactone decarboxylase